nr:hypothetical protein [Tanacetum cinerariifolium]
MLIVKINAVRALMVRFFVDLV